MVEGDALHGWIARCEAGEAKALGERTGLWRVPDPDGDVVVKRFAPRGGLAALGERLFGSRPAARADRAARELSELGIPVPEPLGWATVGSHDYLVTRFVDGVPPGVKLPPRMAQAAGTFVGKLHAAGFLHGDLQLENALRTVDDWVLLDLDRAKRSRRQPPRADRARELATLFRSATAHDPVRFAVWGHFLRGYCRETHEWEPAQRKALTRAALRRLG
ncbi:MAG: lipopolysaccharide kinase InaA family protein [Planctomycetota bacterium]